MIQMLTGLLMRGHKLPPLERNANRPKMPTKRDIIGIAAWRVAGWVLLSMLLVIALWGVVILLVCPAC